MLRSGRWIGVAAALVVAAPLVAALAAPGEKKEPDAAALKPQVERLLKKLESPERAAREQAEKELLDLGAAALPLLPAEDDISDAEVRRRVSRMRLVLQEQQAREQLQASRVTLEAEKIALSKAIEALAQQTGNKLIDFRQELGQPVDDPEITLKLHDAPFWEALDTLCREGSVTVYPYTGQRQIALTAGAEPRDSAAPVSYSGAFRLAA
jgi:hypothetical protein